MEIRQMLMLAVVALLVVVVGVALSLEFGKKQHDLEVQRPKKKPAKTSNLILMIEPFTIDPEFRTRCIVCKKSAIGFEADLHKEVLSLPSQMMTEQTYKWMCNSGLFANVIKASSTVNETHLLKGHIDKAYLDTFSGDKPFSQIETTISLVKRGKPQEVVFSKPYTSTETMVSDNVDDYFNAVNTGVTKILKQLEGDLAEYLNT